MTTHQCPNPIGPGEIAAIVGVTRQRIDQLSREKGFPDPWAELMTGRIWRDSDIREWAANRKVTRGRPKKATS